MGWIYAVVNQKGGVGKTTSAVNLAASLAKLGGRVLLADIDPQANATSGLFPPDPAAGEPIQTTYDVLIRDVPMAQVVRETEIRGLSVAPAGPDLVSADLELAKRSFPQGSLREALQPIRKPYDYILIDGPPTLGLLTVNALTAADFLIIPVQCEYYALEGLTALMKTVEAVRKELNPGLKIDTVIMTMYDGRARLSQQVVAEVQRVFRNKVSATVVPRNVRLSEAPSHGKPVVAYDSRSRGAVAYIEIAKEIMERAKQRTRQGT